MRQRRWLHNDKDINPTRGYTLVNIYARNIGAPKYIEQILTNIKLETDSNTITEGDYKSD